MKNTGFILLLCALAACTSSPPKDRAELKLNIDDKIVGERIADMAELRDTVDGKILFSLLNNTLIVSAPSTSSWQKIGIRVKLSAEELQSGHILPHHDIIALDDQVVGTTVDTVKVSSADAISGMLIAFTKKENIKPSSVPENALSQVLKTQKELNLNTLKDFMYNFNVKKNEYGLEKNEVEYFIYESELLGIGARDRLTLYFKKDQLVAIYHTRPIASPYKSFNLVQGHHMILIQNLSATQIKNLVDKRVKFYTSM